MATKKTPKQPKRECGSCTKCCEGWLVGEAHTHKFWPGRPCHFLSKNGCSIYSSRPENPCKSFKCMWLEYHSIPAWMKPDEINAIFVWRKAGAHTYMSIHEAGSVLRSDVLSWAVHHALENNLSLVYHINGGHHRIGRPDFLNANLVDPVPFNPAEIV